MTITYILVYAKFYITCRKLYDPLINLNMIVRIACYICIQPLRKALELIPVDGNGTTAFITVSYLLAVTMSLDHNVTKLERALQISDDAIRRLASEYTLYIVRYICSNNMEAE